MTKARGAPLLGASTNRGRQLKRNDLVSGRAALTALPSNGRSARRENREINLIKIGEKHERED
ncbi:hypothetical protein FQV39_09250 [Bosea sp. F3-2]|uniref:hypothetical protein n=1 Tax=Bosea sp. F3-2 TaxID=2599640 RepID=UPI0011F02938|nr:hypothetical protein [Bosea sp. F3-2]QEL22730.1 hypothetical protein FQV39_09250 [Bosea sp. F3-2]